MTTVVVLDYGSGNIRSAERAVARAGAKVTVTTDAALAATADGLVVPGVGAFAACMAGLVAVTGPDIIAARLAAGLPTLAIRVGHQVLFDGGIEHGVRADGCKVWSGLVERLHAERLPHMGWNTIQAADGSQMFVCCGSSDFREADVAGLFDLHVARLTELGYATARTQLVWPLGRMLLHRGDPDQTALGVEDLDELRTAIDAFTARLRLDPVREFYSRAPDGRPPVEVADGYLRSAIARLHAVHVLLFDLGQIDQPPTGRVTAGSWVDRLAPPGAPPKIRGVIERYLRLHLDANLDRPQTVRHARDALRRLVTWMTQSHPETASLADLHREHAEEFLGWLGTPTNQQTGAPLSISYRRTVVTLISRFVTETAAWGWDDVPARVLFTRGDIPKIPKPLPRFIPDHELAKLMTAVEQLPNPYQRAALIVARWSGARRDEIRRLAVDCLDTYPDGHPRLRIRSARDTPNA
jgi:hypothetical protein